MQMSSTKHSRWKVVSTVASVTEARSRLRRPLSDGNFAALRALDDITGLVPTQAQAMIRAHARAVRDRVQEARGGSVRLELTIRVPIFCCSMPGTPSRRTGVR